MWGSPGEQFILLTVSMTWFNSLELIVPLNLKFRSSTTSDFSKNSIIFNLPLTAFLKSSSKFFSFRCLPLKKVSRSIRAFWSQSKQSPDVDFSVDGIWSLFVGKTLLILFQNAFPCFAWLTSCNFLRVHSEAAVLSVSLNMARAFRSASWFCGVDFLLYVSRVIVLHYWVVSADHSRKVCYVS